MQDDEPPEITYVVENQGKLQAITPTQPMPCQEELDMKFAELVVSLVVLPAKCPLTDRKSLVQCPSAICWQIRKIHTYTK